MKREREESAPAAAPNADVGRVRESLLSLLQRFPAGLTPDYIENSEIGSGDSIMQAINSALADRLVGLFVVDGKQVLRLVTGEEGLADLT